MGENSFSFCYPTGKRNEWLYLIIVAIKNENICIISYSILKTYNWPFQLPFFNQKLPEQEMQATICQCKGRRGQSVLGGQHYKGGGGPAVPGIRTASLLLCLLTFLPGNKSSVTAPKELSFLVQHLFYKLKPSEGFPFATRNYPWLNFNISFDNIFPLYFHIS